MQDRSRVSWKRRLLQVGGAVVLLLAAAAGVLIARGQQRLERRYEAALGALPAPAADAIARGEHLSHTYGCRHCHGQDLGGIVMEDSPLMYITGPNLTPASDVVGGYQPVDWARALLHGLARDGRPVLIMPSHHFRVLGDADVAALAAYFAQAPAVERKLPPSELHLPAKLLLGLGADMLAAEQLDHAAVRGEVATPPMAATREYGAYLARACEGCHGSDLHGGPAVGPPGSPAPPDISARVMRDWSKPEFVRALREGKKRDGSALSPMMPWEALRHMTDDELTALWIALREGES